MSRQLCGFTILLLTLAMGRSAPGAESGYPFVVIVNKANRLETLNTLKLKVIFMGEISRWPWGAETMPIDMPESSAARQAFLRVILQSTEDRMAVHWIDKKVTLNIDPPAHVLDAESAKRLVAAKPGAVAYIPRSAVDETVKVIQVIP